jgi:RNA polymerase sigma-70 factor (ECF subfamily)
LGKSDGLTTAGGLDRDFPSTSWSVILGLDPSASREIREKALETLCRRYWKPVYYYLRRAWRKSTNEDAKDLTQEYFTWLLEGVTLERYRPDRGSFRGYLKMTLQGFASDQHDAQRAKKRGGDRKRLSLDQAGVPPQDRVLDDVQADPELLFNRAWVSEILKLASERTRAWFESVGRMDQFRAFEAYELNPAHSGVTYAEVASLLGKTESDIRNYLHAVKERFAQEIRAEIRNTVDPRDVEDEFKALFGT